MELGDYVRTGKRRALIVIVALAAAALTVGVLSQSPPQYSSTVDIDVPADSANTASNTALYVANFGTALSTGATKKAIAESLGVPVSRVSGAASASQVGHSTVLRVSYVDESRDVSARGADAAARAGAAALAQRKVQQAQLKVDATRELYNRSVQDLETYQRENGSITDNPQYVALQNSVSNLQEQVSDLDAAGKSSQAQSLRNKLQSDRGKLNDLRERSREESGLQKSAESALSDLNDARRDMTGAEGFATRTTSPAFVTPGSTSEKSQLMAWVQAGVLAAVVAGAAMFGLIALREVSARRRRMRRAAAMSEAQEIDITNKPRSIEAPRTEELENPVRV